MFPFLAIFVSGVVAFAFIVAACACMSVGVGILVTNTAVGLLVMGIGCLLFASENSLLHFNRMAGLHDFPMDSS